MVNFSVGTTRWMFPHIPSEREPNGLSNLRMAAKRQLLTQAEFDAISQSAEWRIVELDLPAIHVIPGIQRKQDVLGAFISGDLNATKKPNGQEANFGMDVFIYEHRPKTNMGEWYVTSIITSLLVAVGSTSHSAFIFKGVRT
jgi:hypothetical protein